MAVGSAIVILCLAAYSDANRIALTRADDGSTVTVVAGTEIDFTLTAMGFGTPLVSSPIIRLMGVYGSPTPGLTIVSWRFAAAAPGQATISIPWENLASLRSHHPRIYRVSVNVVW